MDIRSRRCEERIQIGQFLCEAHWDMLDRTTRQALIRSERLNIKSGFLHFNAEWKRLADGAVKAVFRLLVETKLAQQSGPVVRLPAKTKSQLSYSSEEPAKPVSHREAAEALFTKGES